MAYHIYQKLQWIHPGMFLSLSSLQKICSSSVTQVHFYLKQMDPVFHGKGIMEFQTWFETTGIYRVKVVTKCYFNMDSV